MVSITAVHNFDDVELSIKEILRITKERAVISVLKKAKNYEEIINKIKNHFQVIYTNEDDFDFFLYLKP